MSSFSFSFFLLLIFPKEVLSFPSLSCPIFLLPPSRLLSPSQDYSKLLGPMGGQGLYHSYLQVDRYHLLPDLVSHVFLILHKITILCYSTSPPARSINNLTHIPSPTTSPSQPTSLTSHSPPTPPSPPTHPSIHTTPCSPSFPNPSTFFHRSS